MNIAYKRRIKAWLLAIGMTMAVGGTVVALAIPQTSFAAAQTCTTEFLGFPAWYRGLINDFPDCTVKAPESTDIGLSNFIAVAFILYGGFLFLTSNGDPTGAAKARTTILNAAIGIVIAVASVAIVNLVLRFIP